MTGLKQQPTVGIIDGPHIYFAPQAFGWEIDYRRLREWLDASTDLIRPVYHGLRQPPGEHDPVYGLVRYLAHNGYTVKTKQGRVWITPEGAAKLQGSIIGELSTEILEVPDLIRKIVLFAGHGDLTAAVQSVAPRGVRVVLVSSTRMGDAVQESMVAETLRQAADSFIDLADLESLICKPTAAGLSRSDDAP